MRKMKPMSTLIALVILSIMFIMFLIPFTQTSYNVIKIKKDTQYREKQIEILKIKILKGG